MALLAWTNLIECLCLRDAGAMLDRLSARGLFSTEAVAAARNTLGGYPSPSQAEAEFRRRLLPLVREAAHAVSSELPLAIADSLALYCAASGRLDQGIFALTAAKYQSLPASEPPVPAAGWPAPVPLPKDPAALLTSETLPVTWDSAPQDTILPLYQLAFRLDPDGRKAAVQYSFYLILLRLNESEAESQLQGWLRQHPAGSAALLEKARYSARQKRDAAGATLALLQALRERAPQRQAFLSLPDALHADWLASRHAADLLPRFELTYAPLFRILDLQATDTRLKTGARGPDYLQFLSIRLRLAELITKSNLPSDVLLGYRGWRRTLGWLREMEIPEEQKAEVERARMAVDDLLARMPAQIEGIVITPRGLRIVYATGPEANTKISDPYFFSVGLSGIGSFGTPGGK